MKGGCPVQMAAYSDCTLWTGEQNTIKLTGILPAKIPMLLLSLSPLPCPDPPWLAPPPWPPPKEPPADVMVEAKNSSRPLMYVSWRDSLLRAIWAASLSSRRWEEYWLGGRRDQGDGFSTYVQYYAWNDQEVMADRCLSDLVTQGSWLVCYGWQVCCRACKEGEKAPSLYTYGQSTLSWKAPISNLYYLYHIT